MRTTTVTISLILALALLAVGCGGGGGGGGRGSTSEGQCLVGLWSSPARCRPRRRLLLLASLAHRKMTMSPCRS